MKKVTVIGWQEKADEILAFLQTKGLLEIEKIPLSLTSDLALGSLKNEEKVKELEFLKAKVQYCLTFLTSFVPPEKGLLANFIKTRVKTTYSEYRQIFQADQLNYLYNECEALEDNLADLESSLKEVQEKQKFLASWQALDVEGTAIKETEALSLVAGLLSTKQLAQLESGLTAKKVAFDLTVVNQDEKKVSLVLIWPKAKTKQVKTVLAALEFVSVDLSSYNQTPAAALTFLNEEEQRLKKLIIEYKHKAQELAKAKPALTITLEYLNNQLAKNKALSFLATTSDTYVFTGWLEAEKQNQLTSELEQVEGVADYFFSEPEPNEKPPVVLKNHWLIKPFEAITRMYGLPDYYEQDPTPFMAPFFFLFFGLALGDAGYGLLLLIAMQFLKRRLVLTENSRDWLNLFSLGGLAAIIVGVFTGGYFGFEAAKLPAILRKLIIIDPLNQAIILLLFSWAIGVLQLASGLVIELMDSIRAKQWEEAIYDYFAQLLLLLSVAVVAGVWLGQQIFKTNSPLLLTFGRLGGRLAFAALLFFLIGKGRLLSLFFISLKKIREFFVKKQLMEAAANLIFYLVLVLFALSFFKFISFTVTFAFLGLALIFSSLTRSFLLQLLQAFYELYGMSSYLGDILSYSRLMALGLVSVLIGFVINVMVGLIVGVKVGPLPLGILFGIILAVPLHLLNLLISLLGAFVHPLRLQYVEFFSKFYSNGGQPFKPLKIETEHIYFASEEK